MTEYIIIALLAVADALLVAVLVRQNRRGEIRELEARLDKLQRDMTEEQRASRKESHEAIQQSMQNMSQVLLTAQGNANTAVNENLESIRRLW